MTKVKLSYNSPDLADYEAKLAEKGFKPLVLTKEVKRIVRFKTPVNAPQPPKDIIQTATFHRDVELDLEDGSRIYGRYEDELTLPPVGFPSLEGYHPIPPELKEITVTSDSEDIIKRVQYFADEVEEKTEKPVLERRSARRSDKMALRRQRNRRIASEMATRTRGSHSSNSDEFTNSENTSLDYSSELSTSESVQSEQMSKSASDSESLSQSETPKNSESVLHSMNLEEEVERMRQARELQSKLSSSEQLSQSMTEESQSMKTNGHLDALKRKRKLPRKRTPSPERKAKLKERMAQKRKEQELSYQEFKEEVSKKVTPRNEKVITTVSFTKDYWYLADNHEVSQVVKDITNVGEEWLEISYWKQYFYKKA